MNILDILKQCEPEQIQLLVSTLREEGIVLDNQIEMLSASISKKWSEEAEQYLRDAGYSGGEIETRAKHFQGTGEIFVFYDSLKFTDEEAMKHLDSMKSRYL